MLLPRLTGSMDFLTRTHTALAMQRATCLDPAAAQRQVLADLLDQATDSRFGREHELHGVRTLADWQRAVPVRSYSDFRPYIDAAIDGQHKVLTRSEPYAFLKTSGTSGSPKLVPTTRHWRMNYRGPALYAQWGLYFQLLGLRKVHPWTALDLSWDRTVPTVVQGGFPVYGISQRWESLGGNDWTPPWFSMPWFADQMDGIDSTDRLYAKMRLLVGKDVRIVVAVNPSKIVLLAEQLRDRGEEMIRDVREGTLLGRPHPALTPDREMAVRLSALRGFHRRPLRLTDLWPRLDLVVCWMSSSARFYESWLRDLIPDVAILPFSTTGTEGIVTLPVDGHPSAGPLAANQGLFEFFEVGDDGEVTGDPVPAPELSRRVHYRLVMSQANGLYRYDVGDTYRVTGWVGATPRLEFSGRAGVGSSFTGEKLTDADLHTTVARVTTGCGSSMPMFTAIPVWDTPPRYVVALEVGDGFDAADLLRLAEPLEETLQQVNIEYAEKRLTNRLAPIQVLPLRPGAFRRVTEYRLGRGAAPAQIKHHWLQSDAQLLSVFAELGVADDAVVAGAR